MCKMRLEIDSGSPEGQAYINRISPTDEEVEGFKLTKKQIRKLFHSPLQGEESDILTARVIIAAARKLTVGGKTPKISEVREATDMYFVRTTGDCDLDRQIDNRIVECCIEEAGFARWNSNGSFELLINFKPRE